MSDIEDLRQQPPTFIDNDDLAGLQAFAEVHDAEIRSDPALSFNTGWAFVRLESPGAAIPYLEHSIALDPTQHLALWGLGTACGKAGMPDRAEQAFRQAIELRDGWAPRYSLAVLLLQQSRGDEGEELLREGLAQSPNSRTRLTELADYLEDRGNRAEAEELRSRAHELADDAGHRS